MKYVPKSLGKDSEASSGAQSKMDHAKTLIIGLSAVAGIFFAAKSIADLAAAGMPDSWEVALSKSVFDEFEFEKNDSQLPQSILDRLIQGQKVRQLNYRLVTIDESLPNAFALPGGIIGLTHGILNEPFGVVGLATIIAHELGHHQHRHVVKRFTSTILSTMLLSGGSGSLTSILKLMSLKNSRDQERQADSFAAKLVFDAYGTVKGAEKFFEHIGGSDSKWGAANAWGATHPMTEDRINFFKNWKPE